MWPRHLLDWHTPMRRPRHILSRVPLPLTMERNHSPSLRSQVCYRPQQPSAPTSICELLKRYDVATPTDQSARSVASPRPIKTRAGAICSDPGHVSMRSEQANGVDVAAFLSAEEKTRCHSSSEGFSRRKNTNSRDGQANICHEYESDDHFVARFPRTIKVGRDLTVR